MKKLIFLLVVLSSNFSTNAQKLEMEKYKQLVDYMTCICINNALENNSEGCVNSSIARDDAKMGGDKTLALYDEFQKLKNTETGNEMTVEFLTSKVFNSPKYERIKGFAEKRKGEKIEGVLTDIKNRANFIISGELKEGSQTSEQLGQNDGENPTSLVGQESGDEIYNSSITETKAPEYGTLDFMKDYGFSSMLFILIIVFFVYQKRRNLASINRVEFMINENEKNREPRLGSNIATVPSNQNREFDHLLKGMNEKIISLENEIRNLKDNEIQSKKDILSPVVTLEIPKAPTLNQEEKVFYKHAPHENGSFDADNDVSLNDAVFKFTISKSNSNSASFELIKDQKKLILDYPNKYIKPVCDELNALNQNANSISVTPGIVEKRNNQWVLKTKAKIKYE